MATSYICYFSGRKQKTLHLYPPETVPTSPVATAGFSRRLPDFNSSKLSPLYQETTKLPLQTTPLKSQNRNSAVFVYSGSLNLLFNVKYSFTNTQASQHGQHCSSPG
jgi:hypothetical protein